MEILSGSGTGRRDSYFFTDGIERNEVARVFCLHLSQTSVESADVSVQRLFADLELLDNRCLSFDVYSRFA